MDTPNGPGHVAASSGGMNPLVPPKRPPRRRPAAAATPQPTPHQKTTDDNTKTDHGKIETKQAEETRDHAQALLESTKGEAHVAESLDGSHHGEQDAHGSTAGGDQSANNLVTNLKPAADLIEGHPDVKGDSTSQDGHEQTVVEKHESTSTPSSPIKPLAIRRKPPPTSTLAPSASPPQVKSLLDKDPTSPTKPKDQRESEKAAAHGENKSHVLSTAKVEPEAPDVTIDEAVLKENEELEDLVRQALDETSAPAQSEMTTELSEIQAPVQPAHTVIPAEPPKVPPRRSVDMSIVNDADQSADAHDSRSVAAESQASKRTSKHSEMSSGDVWHDSMSTAEQESIKEDDNVEKTSADAQSFNEQEHEGLAAAAISESTTSTTGASTAKVTTDPPKQSVDDPENRLQVSTEPTDEVVMTGVESTKPDPVQPDSVDTPRAPRHDFAKQQDTVSVADEDETEPLPTSTFPDETPIPSQVDDTQQVPPISDVLPQKSAAGVQEDTDQAERLGVAPIVMPGGFFDQRPSAPSSKRSSVHSIVKESAEADQHGLVSESPKEPARDEQDDKDRASDLDESSECPVCPQTWLVIFH